MGWLADKRAAEYAAMKSAVARNENDRATATKVYTGSRLEARDARAELEKTHGKKKAGKLIRDIGRGATNE